MTATHVGNRLALLGIEERTPGRIFRDWSLYPALLFRAVL